MAKDYTKRVKEYLSDYIAKNGLTLLDVTFTREEGQNYLRVFIGMKDEDKNVSIDDCVKLSRVLSKWLDKEDFIRETYTLEVCSGGFLSDPST